MRRALTLGLAGLVATTSCWHEVKRERIVLRGTLTDTGASVVIGDWVDLEKSCVGDKIELGILTVLTLGLAWVINDAIENKLGHPTCPHTDTRRERQQQFDTAFATVPNAPRRIALESRPRACEFDTDGDCSKDESPSSYTIATSNARGWSRIERGTDNKLHITLADNRGGKQTLTTIDLPDEPWMKIGPPMAIDASGGRLVVRGPEPHTCWLVTRATGAATRFDDCDGARWLDAHTALIAKRLVDIDTNETYPASYVVWLGKGLGLAYKDKLVEIVRRGPWRVLASVTPVAYIDEPDQLTIIGTGAIVVVRPDGNVTTNPIPIVPGRILDVRGDLALVVVANEQLTAATIRLSTGQLVARTP
jgi:hypothetical protein